MIVVTGASGQLGRRVVHGLLADLPPLELGVSVRDPAKVPEFAEHGIRAAHQNGHGLQILTRTQRHVLGKVPQVGRHEYFLRWRAW